MPRSELWGCLTDVVADKAGLFLDRWDMMERLPGNESLFWGAETDEVQMPGVEFDALVSRLLYSIGNISRPTPEASSSALYEACGSRKELRPIVDGLDRVFDAAWQRVAPRRMSDLAIVLDEFASSAKSEYGAVGGGVAKRFWQLLTDVWHADPWSGFKRRSWENVVGLYELFDSESLHTPHGSFLDQRFVDYLAQNPSAVDQMHWRKFEGLTGEFFDRRGYRVKLGRGRGDGNIDALLWSPDSGPEGPPETVVQCKRQSANVSAVIVKALWADVQIQRAQSGLIVTSSRLAPGARKLCSGPLHQISEADRATVMDWLNSMSSIERNAVLAA